MSHGSQQIRLFRRAVRDGSMMEAAANMAGISIGEARLIIEDDRRNPPPPEAYQLLYDPDATAAALTTKDDDMARGRTARKQDDDDSGEVKAMDFERAKKLYLNDIKPAKSEASSQGQTVAEAMKIIKKQCHIEPQGARKAMSAFEMEDAHREIHIRSFVGMFNSLMGSEVLTCNFGDLVDQAQDAERKDRPKPKLVSPPPAAPDDSYLSSGIPFSEATEEELAQQDGRGDE